ncbi:MAG TPA: hypothetical protein VFP59_08620 [Candidatus Angelobacter sp.]|nr:hypothetical protein [Candidatus Angelobacter sp.]
MTRGQRSGSIWFARKHTALSVAAIVCCCGMIFGCKKGSATNPAAVKTEDPATRELRAIGDRVTAAVIGKNINTLLEYDHDPEDQASLENKSGDLYCYLFVSSCIPEAKTRAVYDILTMTPQLAVDASIANLDGKQYGLLMFYDKSKISSSELYSPDFLCSDKALKQTASWHFVNVNGKWISSTLFDYKMDRSCKQ